MDGVWSDWVNSTCTALCGGGTFTIRKTCDSPAPANGGNDCIGDVDSDGVEEQTINCNTHNCPSKEQQKIANYFSILPSI